MARPVPGRTGDEPEPLAAAGIRGSRFTVGRGSPSVGFSIRRRLARPLASSPPTALSQIPLKWETRPLMTIGMKPRRRAHRS